MPVTLSIKSVPDRLTKALRERARRNHRSIQGELMTILEDALEPKPFQAKALLAHVRALGVHTPRNEATQLVRETRDTR